MEPGSTAGVLIWENLWAAPFASAARRSGGQLKTAVVAAAVTPGRDAPVAKTAVVAAAVTPGRRRRI